MIHLVCVTHDGTECRHQSDTEDERDRVDPLIAVLVGMELGNEIRGGEIDERARRCGQEPTEVCPYKALQSKAREDGHEGGNEGVAVSTGCSIASGKSSRNTVDRSTPAAKLRSSTWRRALQRSENAKTTATNEVALTRSVATSDRASGDNDAGP
jgi:hypothetical protein